LVPEKGQKTLLGAMLADDQHHSRGPIGGKKQRESLILAAVADAVSHKEISSEQDNLVLQYKLWKNASHRHWRPKKKG